MKVKSGIQFFAESFADYKQRYGSKRFGFAFRVFHHLGM